MKFKTLIPAAVLALATMLPAAADASDNWIQCAVQSTDAPGVIIAVGTSSTQAQIGVAGAVCTDMINTGQAIGVDSGGSWRVLGFNPYCSVHVTPTDQFDVYVQSDSFSRMFADGFCGSAGNKAVSVEYY